jgi:hypothetical protein
MSIPLGHGQARVYRESPPLLRHWHPGRARDGKLEPLILSNAGSFSYRWDSGNSSALFSKAPVLKMAVDLLMQEGVLVCVTDEFAPPAYKKSGTYQDWFYKVAPEKFVPFAKYKQAKNDKDWIIAALHSVNNTYDALKMTADDFELAQQEPELEWEPLPIDRADPKLQEVEEKLDEAIAAIQGDNGYAASVPGEREYVLSHLRSFSETLKNKAEVYGRQIKTDAIEPLTRVVKRFGDAVVGIAAASARAALFEWLKAHWPKLVAWLFS